jgi:hypothetical protein
MLQEAEGSLGTNNKYFSLLYYYMINAHAKSTKTQVILAKKILVRSVDDRVLLEEFFSSLAFH